VLRDPEKRERYDRLGQNWKAGQDVSGASGFNGFEGFDNVRVDFGGGDFGGEDFSDFFEGLFGDGRAGAPGAAGAPAASRAASGTRGSDREAVIELTLEEAAAGGRRRITLATGATTRSPSRAACATASASGSPARAGPGTGGGPSGDLFLRVRLLPHPRFRLRGRDLEVDLPVTPWEAALGATVDVPTLQGDARLKVPAHSSCGRRLRLRGEGLPNANGTDGDLHAVVKIVVPKRLKREERELFERLAEVSNFDPRKER
jgi:curved DNA-binding protein